MSGQQSKKVDFIRVLIENRLNNGTEPANFSPDLLTNNQLFNLGKGFSEAPLLPNATSPIYATHLSHNNSNYLLSLAPSAGNSSPGPIEAGPPVPLQGGKKVDIQQWTIMANPKF